MAGFVAFSAFLSLFPFLIFATALISFLLGSTDSDRILNALFDIAPEHVARTIEPVITDVLTSRNTDILTYSAAFAIWVASNAVESIRVAFDRAYSVTKPRGYIFNRLKAIMMVFFGAVVAALLGVSIILSPLLLRLAEQYSHVEIPLVAGYLTYGFGILVFVGTLYMTHRVLPGRSMKKINIWPGVLVTTLIWVIAASGFSVYLSYAPSYTVTYGTLAGVIITLMFFYLTGATFIYGAEFNAAMERARLGKTEDTGVGNTWQ